MAALDLGGEEKPETLDFSMLSNVLQTELESSSKEETTSKKYPTENSEATERDALQEEIKEECPMSNELEDNPMKLRDEHFQTNNGEDVGVKEENVTPQSISIVELKGARQDCKSSVDAESCHDVSCASSDCDMEESSDDNEGATWTREEDRTILCTFQSEPDREKVLENINANLPHRSIEEVSTIELSCAILFTIIVPSSKHCFPVSDK